jgi:uncharacterized membrane protein
VITIVQKIWAGLSGLGNKVAESFGLKALIGSSSVTLTTTMLLIFIFYLVGFLVRFSFLTRFRDWLENAFLQYIPGYITYKAKMQEKLLPKKDARVPVLVKDINEKKPAFLIQQQGNESIVFYPNTPDSNNGHTRIVLSENIIRLPIYGAAFSKCLQAFGKDMPIT